MAQIEAGWSSRHEEKIKELERKLGREVCGVLRADGTPCSRWPTPAGEGRCSKHANQESFPEQSDQNITDENERRRVKVVAPPEQSATTSSKLTSLQDWKSLLALALVAFFVGAVLTYTGLRLTSSPESKETTSNNTVEASNEFEVDVDDPDFSRLQEFARGGVAARIAPFLQQIIDETDSPEARAEALYRLFVFYESQAEFELALQTAERFLSNFFGHPRTPEILYGAWFISVNLVDDSARAERYRRRLLADYPDSRWAEQLP